MTTFAFYNFLYQYYLHWQQ